MNCLYLARILILEKNDVMENHWDRFQTTNSFDGLNYLGMEVEVNLGEKTIILWQLIYLMEILKQYGISNCRPAKISISLGVVNSFIVYKNKAEKSTVVYYQSAIGAFIWPAIHSPPDSAFSVKVLSHFCSNPRPTYVKLVKHVLQ